YSFTRISGRVAKGAWSWSEGAPLRRGAVAAITFAAVAMAGYVLLPNGEYRPIQANERGTIQGGVKQFASLPSGRPGLTSERASELGGAPTRHEQPGTPRQQEQR